MAVIGIVVGAAVGWVVTKTAAAYIPSLQVPGPLPLAGAMLVLVMATVVAALIPAVRAARTSPCAG